MGGLSPAIGESVKEGKEGEGQGRELGLWRPGTSFSTLSTDCKQNVQSLNIAIKCFFGLAPAK